MCQNYPKESAAITQAYIVWASIYIPNFLREWSEIIKRNSFFPLSVLIREYFHPPQLVLL